jgi:hypothetical protein
MQPLKPEEREKIRKEHPQAAPGDLEQYERLLSQRFTVDPDSPQPAPAKDEVSSATVSSDDIEEELEKLHRRIFKRTETANSRTARR